jgi:hypothetical protein
MDRLRGVPIIQTAREYPYRIFLLILKQNQFGDLQTIISITWCYLWQYPYKERHGYCIFAPPSKALFREKQGWRFCYTKFDRVYLLWQISAELWNSKQLTLLVLSDVNNRVSATSCALLDCIMPFVDRSNTNWTPWPRLSGIPQRLQVIGGIVTIFAAAGVLHTLSRRSGPPLPRTLSKEWKDATVKSYEAKEREAAGPIVLNPITRSREN